MLTLGISWFYAPKLIPQLPRHSGNPTVSESGPESSYIAANEPGKPEEAAKENLEADTDGQEPDRAGNKEENETNGGDKAQAGENKTIVRRNGAWS